MLQSKVTHRDGESKICITPSKGERSRSTSNKLPSQNVVQSDITVKNDLKNNNFINISKQIKVLKSSRHSHSQSTNYLKTQKCIV